MSTVATGIGLRRLQHLVLWVGNVDRSVRFYTEVLGMPLWEREADHATVRCGNGFIGLWLPGAWALKTPDGATLDLRGGARQHFNFWINNRDGQAALENLQRHGVKYYGPRYNEKGEIHIDFEDPDGHLLEYWGRDSFEAPPDKTP